MEPGRNNYPFRDWRDDMEDGTFHGGQRRPRERSSIYVHLALFCVWLASIGLVTSILVPIFLGLISCVVQSYLFLKNGIWPGYTVVDLLSHKQINVEWAQQPETMFGVHKLFAATDLWMLLPIGLIWAAAVLAIARMAVKIARY